MPGNFKQFFDTRKMTERQLGQMEFVLNSPAWEETFKPYLLDILSTMNVMWRDRSQKRKDEYPDDFLAGGACFGEGLLKFFDLIVQDTNLERVHEAMANLTNDDLYDIARSAGRVQPVVGLDQPAMPAKVDPAAEDY